MNRATAWWILWVIGASASVQAAQPLGCLIEPQQVAEVGSPVIGVVQELLVERGDRVVKGQVLALLRGEVERAAVGVASSRAQAEADEQAARANVGFACQKLERAQDQLRGIVRRMVAPEECPPEVAAHRPQDAPERARFHRRRSSAGQ